MIKKLLSSRTLLNLMYSGAFLAAIAFVKTSTNATWFWGFHQRECPKSLIKADK